MTTSQQKVRVWIAASADGYIATSDGDIAWLDAFNARDPAGLQAAFDGFIADVGAIVMGRSSFEKVLTFGAWPYGNRPAFIVTSRPISADAPFVRGTGSDMPEIIARAKQACSGQVPGHVWVDGGGITISGLIDAGLIDELDVLCLPVLLGNGIPLFPPSGRAPVMFTSIESRPGLLGGTWLRLNFKT